MSDLVDLSALRNPVLPGWYADPELRFHDGLFWIYPTCSLSAEEQTYFDMFSSPDLVTWTKHPEIFRLPGLGWGKGISAWAPSVLPAYGSRFMYFSAGDGDGIGLAVWHKFTRRFVDALGRALVREWPFGAQPIDANAFLDDDGTAWLYFGGHARCVAARLRPDLNGLAGDFQLITPAGYVEGPFMFKRCGRYYFTWSEGDWVDDTYGVAYAIADNPLGPFERIGCILKGDGVVGTGAGHASFLLLPGTSDDWVIAYHRRPVGDTEPNHRVSCIDRVFFRADGTIEPVRMT
jgi:beta-xylosidase